jgi:branched-chain amino acid transport system ATP-binding protein
MCNPVKSWRCSGRNGSGRSTTAKAIMGMVDWEGLACNWKGQELKGKKAL